MLRSWRRLFKKGAEDRQPATEVAVRLRGPGSRSRFLSARYKEPGIAGRSLAYHLYLPRGAGRSAPLPLMVMMHGCNQDAVVFAAGTRMNALAEEHRFAVLYPEQNKRANALRCWNWFESASLDGGGEAELIARLIERVASRRLIDPHRVHIVGMSAGGAMACILAVRHSHLFAGCAIHSGLMYGAASSPMQAFSAMSSGASAAAVDRAQSLLRGADPAAVTVPTLVIHGQRDATVNPVNAAQIIAQLRARAELIDPAAGALVPGAERRVEGAGHTYFEQDYRQRDRTVLREIMIEGLGHAWSGGDPRYDFNDGAGPDSSRLIVDFML